jgi:hypothetical protein
VKPGAEEEEERDEKEIHDSGDDKQNLRHCEHSRDLEPMS